MCQVEEISKGIGSEKIIKLKLTNRELNILHNVLEKVDPVPLSPQEKRGVKRALKDIKEGRVYTHEEMKEIRCSG